MFQSAPKWEDNKEEQARPGIKVEVPFGNSAE